jgi:hypothetical protein
MVASASVRPERETRGFSQQIGERRGALKTKYDVYV